MEMEDTKIKLNDRVARLEEGLVGLRSEVHTLAESMRHDIGSVTTAVDQLRQLLARRSETNWGVYFSGVGVLLAFVMAMGGGALAPLYIMGTNNDEQMSLVRNSVQTLSNDFDDHQKLSGHPTAIQMHKEVKSTFADFKIRLENGLQELDEKLQREMQLADATQQQRIFALDDKLQRELTSIVTNEAKETLFGKLDELITVIHDGKGS